MKPIDGPLLIATHNAGKLAEFRTLFAPLGIELRDAGELGLPEPAETEDTFLGNARIKARAGLAATGMATLADDSGIEIDALDGAPGVYTADWAQTPAGRDFGAAMARTWDELEARDAPEPRTARFRCTLLLLRPDGSEDVFDGVLAGRVAWPPRGSQGHGYDPIFIPEGHDRTLGELEPAEKNALSHRARAMAALRMALRDDA